MDKQLKQLSMAFVIGMSLVACTHSSHKPKSDAGAGDAGMHKADAGKPDAGKHDSGSTTTMMTTPPPPPVPCGSTMCQQPASPLGMLGGLIPGGAGGLGGLIPMPVACCLDEASATCGMSTMTGGKCEAMAKPDMRCPSVDLGALAAFAGMGGFGCCTSDGQCGVDGSAFGRGCVPNMEANAMLASMGLGGFIMIPAPKPCAGGDEDGGMMSTEPTDAGN